MRDGGGQEEHLWKSLYKIHIDSDVKDEEVMALDDPNRSWKKLFIAKWKLPRWDPKHKHSDIVLQDNDYTCYLSPNVHAEDRSVRLSHGIDKGKHFIEFLVTRGRYHTLFGVCDEETAQCKTHHKPWSVATTKGVSACYASDGGYYGSTSSNVNRTMEKWKNNDKVGILVNVTKVEHEKIRSFTVQFFMNGSPTGGVFTYENLSVKMLYVVACLYGEDERLTIVSSRHPLSPTKTKVKKVSKEEAEDDMEEEFDAMDTSSSDISTPSSARKSTITKFAEKFIKGFIRK